MSSSFLKAPVPLESKMPGEAFIPFGICGDRHSRQWYSANAGEGLFCHSYLWFLCVCVCGEPWNLLQGQDLSSVSLVLLIIIKNEVTTSS